MGLTQAQFAEQYSVSDQTVRNWESGLYKVPQRVIDDLVFNLGIDANFILGKTSDPFQSESLKKFNNPNLASETEQFEFYIKLLESFNINISEIDYEDLNSILKDIEKYIKFRINELKGK